MALRCFVMACWVSPDDCTNSSYVRHESSASNASISEFSKIFSYPPPCQSSTSESLLLKRWNHSRHVLSLRATSPYVRKNGHFFYLFLFIFFICLFRLALTVAAIYRKTAEAKLYTKPKFTISYSFSLWTVLYILTNIF